MVGFVGSVARRLFDGLVSAAPDYPSVQLRHFQAHRRFSDLRSPRLFSEYVQRRSLYDRDPRLPLLADKIAAKAVVEEELGPEWLIPTLWSGTDLPPRDERNWPMPYVIKAAHGSSWNHFVRKPEDADPAIIEPLVEGWLASDYAKRSRERFYSRIPRRLLVEPLVGNPAELPTDIKFFCFGGVCEYVMVQAGRHSELTIATMDRDWRMLPLNYGRHARPRRSPERPQSYDAMLRAAERLSKDFDFARMDFYEIDGRPLFGEYTFTPGAGREPFEPPAFNAAFGEKWRRAIATKMPGASAPVAEGVGRLVIQQWMEQTYGAG